MRTVAGRPKNHSSCCVGTRSGIRWEEAKRGFWKSCTSVAPCCMKRRTAFEKKEWIILIIPFFGGLKLRDFSLSLTSGTFQPTQMAMRIFIPHEYTTIKIFEKQHLMLHSGHMPLQKQWKWCQCRCSFYCVTVLNHLKYDRERRDGL